MATVQDIQHGFECFDMPMGADVLFVLGTDLKL